MYKYFFEVLLIFFLATSCNERKSPKAEPQEVNLDLPKKEAQPFPDSLTVNDYRNWIMQQKGVTYDIEENEDYKISILYKPLILEAALSGESLSEIETNRYLDIKKGFHYLIVEYLEKKRSASNGTTKSDVIFNKIKDNLYFIKNNSDTIENPILEFFPSSIMNMPHQIIALVPADSLTEGIKAGFRAKEFGLNDLSLSMSAQQINSFPKIKY